MESYIDSGRSIVSGSHRITIDSRKSCKISGVVDALSFDEHEVMLETVDGMLKIRGNDMHVSRLNLDKGELDVEGRVDCLEYTDKTTFSKKTEGLLTRLFS